MKNCGECNWPWPDYVDTCSVCGSQQFNDPSLATPPSTIKQLPLCCSNAECASLMFFNGAKYCSECGRKLQPVSWSAWEEKVVYPALEKDVSGVAFDPSKLLQSALKMGFVPEEAESHFNNLFERATNVSRNDFCAWVKESVLPLQDDKNGSTTAPRQALLWATRLKISEPYAERVLSQVVAPTDISSGPAESNVASETVVPGLGSLQQRDLIDTAVQESQVTALSTNEAPTDPLRNSAKSFYRRLVAGGSVTNNLTFLDFKKSALKEGIRNTDEFLKEATHDGAFVLFVSSETQGWVFPNPKLMFAADSLKPLFPALTADQFNHFKEHIEPVPVIRVGKDRWQSQPAEKNTSESQRTSRASTGAKAPERLKSEVIFPVSAADCLAKMQSSSQVVRHEVLRDILVSGPDDKGELALIHHSGTSSDTQSLLAVPRLTRFMSRDAFYFFYDRYYDCAKPSAGMVWIIKPAVVSKVPGGWQLRQKGVLEIDWVRKEEKSPVQDVKPDISEIDQKQVPAPVDYPLPQPVPKWRLRLVIGIISSLILLGATLMGIRRTPSPSNAIKNTNRTLSPPVNMVLVSGGEFPMGSDAGDDSEEPVHIVNVRPFFIDVNEVTCEDYQKFVKATNHRFPPNWNNGQHPNGAARRPVTGVDWEDANAYARWTGKRLPTEEEWELAARGTTGWRYPWGDDWRTGAANAGDSNLRQLTDVGTYPAGKSPSGAMDMIGNAWEWTSSEWKGYPGGSIPPDASKDLRVIRGGYWGSSAAKATTTFRRGWDARGAKAGYENTGFRCAADVTAPAGNK